MAEEGHPRRWLELAVVLSAAFMQLIDVSIVNVAIPSIESTLHASSSQIQMVIAGYQLAYAVLLVTGGRLGDLYGRKKLFLIGMAGFVLSSAACGAAVSATMLVISRIVQGLFASLMYPQVLAVIQVGFPSHERAKAFGIFGSVVGVGTIAGPLLGGLLIAWNVFGLDWRPIFLVNVVIGVPAFVAAWLLLRDSRAPEAKGLDLLGVVVLTAALFLVVWPLVAGRQLGWPWWSFVCMAVGVLALVGFGLLERARTRARRAALVDTTLFEDRAFTIGLWVSLIFFFGVPAFFLIFTLHLQIGLNFSPLHAGLSTLPFAVAAAGFSAASIRLAPRFGKKVLSAGALVMAVGMGGVLLTVYLARAQLTSWDLIPALFVAGTGMGLVVAPLIDVVLAGVAPRHAGSASGVLTTVQQVGGAFGVAVIGVIFFGLLPGRGRAAASEVARELTTRLQASGMPRHAAEGVAHRFHACAEATFAQRNAQISPPGCGRSADPPSPGANRLGEAMAEAGREAKGRAFAAALVDTQWVEIAAFLLVFLLLFRLPDPRRAAR